ncbi:MAG: hypothetical protein AABX65_00820 [Nanoarchaeota archaeon]
MMYRIYLNEGEIETLKRTVGFNKLPVLLSRGDIETRVKKKEFFTAPYSMVYSYHSHISLLGLRAEETRVNILNLFLKYTDIDKDRHVPIDKMLARFNEIDRTKYNLLCPKNDALSKECGKEDRRVMKIVRNLYGVLGIVREHGKTHKYWYSHYIIPPENNLAVINAVSNNGIFEKELNGEDLDLLKFLLRRTREIKEGKKHGYNPAFSVPRILNEFGGNRKEIRESLERLTGVLCHVYGPEVAPVQLGDFEKYILYDNWLIPHIGFEIAEEVLRR